MDSSDSEEEGEIPLEYVDEYYFVDKDESPIAFSALPVKWKDQDSPGNSSVQVHLRGTIDCGNLPVYKHVTAWKFELSHARPKIFVLVSKKNWVMLQKPRKSYEAFIRTILITLHCLHFIKSNPEALEKHVWSNLRKIFGSFDVLPSEGDLLDHIPLMREAAKGDKDLAKSKYLLAFLEKPSEAISIKAISKKSRFIVDEDEEEDSSTEDDYEMDLPFDPVCSICDNGGSVLCCEGRCLRSFHATVADGIDTACESLGFMDQSQVYAIPNFLCNNCLYKQHQCYACGKLGSSDESPFQEVFPCSAANCGHFYHPECVAKLLHADNKVKSKELQAKIARREESFYCPLHKCLVCNLSENKDEHELQLAVCRRCPKAYHRKCLPREITFENEVDENKFRRAWEGLLPYNRILIYCLDHDICDELLTPSRDHLVFPNVDGKPRIRSQGLPSIQDNIGTLKRKITSTSSSDRTLTTKYPKHPEQALGHSGIDALPNKLEKRCGDEFDRSKKQKIDNHTEKRNRLKEMGTSSSVNSIRMDNDILSLRTIKRPTIVGLPAAGATLPRATSNKINTTKTVKPVQKRTQTSQSSARVAMENRITALIDEVESSFSFEEFIKSQNTPQVRSYHSRNNISKNITLGLVQNHANAARAALEMIKEGRHEDAKALFDPGILLELMKLKKQLEIRLAPFLHGMRYTSFGRHFTNPEKLIEIVDRLHWYVQGGDTIVDFCCGSNDFSCLMKEKLEKTGKLCFFKNYDLIQPKKDFNFEQRDWMSVNAEELADGSRLIMGLNPPFGYKASLANKFIRKALEFRPKILILIVPSETKRVDKRAPYDLIWEDTHLLSGKSFYLPGSIDVNDEKLEQWNLRPPPLYLWSRSDWTSCHRAIALKHAHITPSHDYNARFVNPVFNYTTQASHNVYGAFTGVPETTEQDFIPSGRSFSGNRNLERVHIPGAALEGDDGMCVDMDISPISSPSLRSSG